MSLTMAFYNARGIIMSADHMICASTTKNEVFIKYQSSQTEHKIFLMENKYGLSYTGTANVGPIPLSCFLTLFISKNPIHDLNPSEWLLDLAQGFNEFYTNNENIIFTLCGYYHGDRVVITTNTQSPEITNIIDDGILYSGENDFVSMLIKTDIIKFNYGNFTLQDAANFLRFLNTTVAGLMKFGECLPTVSESCDILAILPDNAYWLNHLELC
ncbi:MAG: hypothetical protein K1W30_00490 [Lachnospiraceae bacterium]